MRSCKTSDGYVFFESDYGWVDSIRNDGTPYRIDMWTLDSTIEEWIEEGFADVFEWSDKWTPLYEGPFDSEEDALVYRDAEVNRVMPTRIRSTINKKDGQTLWWIDCKHEVTA